jgi:hypothetical protein
VVSARYEPIDRTPSVVFGACAGVWIMTVFAEPKLLDMKAARPALQTMSKKHPRGFPTLTWVLPEAGFRMDTDARNAASEVTREFQGKIVAQATLIEGSGFQVAAVRAILAGMDFMSRSKAPKKTFSELSDAVAWCLANAPKGTEPLADDKVTASLLDVRRSLPGA